MFCGNCGKENKPGAKFCKSCGKPLSTGFSNQGPDTQANTNNDSNNNRVNQYVGNGGQKPPSQFISKLKAIPKKFYIGGGVGLAAIIVAIVIIVINMGTIDLNKYLRIQSSGYDGYGTVTATIDWDALKQDHASDLKPRNSSNQQYNALSYLASSLLGTNGLITVSFDKSEGLSNGDTVSYKLNVEQFLQYYDAKIKYSDGKYTVSNLKEVEKYDVFANVELKYSGISPNGKVSVSYTGNEFNSYYFQVDKSSGLKNGDTVTVSLTGINMENVAKRYGRIPEATSKEYTVSGLEEYVLSYSELTETTLSKAKKEAEDVIASKLASSYYRYSVSNLEYVGYYFETLKGTGGYGYSQNMLYVVYSGDVSSSDGKVSDARMYFPVRFSDIVKKGDGGFNYNSNVTISGSSNLGKYYYSISGYISGTDMYKSIITGNRDKYNYEVSEGLKQFGE